MVVKAFAQVADELHEDVNMLRTKYIDQLCPHLQHHAINLKVPGTRLHSQVSISLAQLTNTYIYDRRTRHIYTLTKNVVALNDDIAEIDPHAILNAAIV